MIHARMRLAITNMMVSARSGINNPITRM
jgi:hypothetical protein